MPLPADSVNSGNALGWIAVVIPALPLAGVISVALAFLWSGRRWLATQRGSLATR
jgi:hypothetical protein